MQIIIKENNDEVSEYAAQIFKKQIENNPKSVLGLATGTTPLGLYKKLIELHKQGLSFAQVKTINLDEYLGLGADDTQSYVYFMRETLFKHIDIDLNNTRLPDGKTNNLEKECKIYSEYVRSVKPDIQLLGIGSNGHIAFNEPGTPFDSVTQVVDLHPQTIEDNSRLFNSIDEVPKKAITLGLSDIMCAKSIVLMATGKNKADAVFDMIKAAPDENCPASILQNHPNVTVILDKEAAARL